jgi:4-hydroxy-tetrahydrodipicolinate reductase
VTAKAAGTHGVCIVGALGRMGERVRAALGEEPTLRLAAALEAKGHAGLGTKLPGGVEVTDDRKAALACCAVAIDFSVPDATIANLRVAAETGVAYVTGTTGFSAEQSHEIAELSERVPIVRAANFSLAVNVLIRLVRQAAHLLGEDYDAELVEVHHAQKRDAPSGTALRLAEAVADGRGDELLGKLILDREGEIGPRPKGAIGVQTLRGGDNTGEHTVMFIGRGERIELIHRSHTRDHFARGAVRAAAWLVGRPPGFYPIEKVFRLE